MTKTNKGWLHLGKLGSMDYDIICIGAGSGGLNIASFTNRIGLKTLLVDKTDRNIGGDCLNFGCVPSKALIHISRLFHDAKLATPFGLRTSGIADLSKVMKYVDNKKEYIREHESADYFRKKGMDVALGTAKFINKNTIKVNNEEYSAKKIIIATGSRPRELRIPGIERLGKDQYLTNENIFNIKKLPKRLLVIGGGPIGCELGQAFARLGSKVTIIARSTILNKESKEVQKIMNETLEKELTILNNTKPLKILGPSRILVKDSKTNKESKLDFDAILVSIGRILNTELDLEKAGVEMDEKGKIIVDEYLRTTNKNILTCGDIAGGFQFTHAAELHAGVILNNAFSPLKKKLNYDKFSWVTFTDPEIATWGLSEEQLKEKGVEYEKLVSDLKHDDRSITDSESGKLILYITKNKTIAGGTLVRKNAGEIAQELILATHKDLKLKDIFSKIYAYPTAARINKSIIANHMGKNLSEFTKKLLRFFYH